MARMNISIPDPLYERLDRLRDRINASKVCAGALEKELDMIEAPPSPADPEIEQLVQRLQGLRERWYDRGRQDGKRWAVGSATREELYRFADEWGGEAAEELAQIFLHPEHGPHGPGPWAPAGVDFAASLQRWLETDAGDPRPDAGTPATTPPTPPALPWTQRATSRAGGTSSSRSGRPCRRASGGRWAREAEQSMGSVSRALSAPRSPAFWPPLRLLRKSLRSRPPSWRRPPSASWPPCWSLVEPTGGGVRINGYGVARQPGLVRQRLGAALTGERSVYWGVY